MRIAWIQRMHRIDAEDEVRDKGRVDCLPEVNCPGRYDDAIAHGDLPGNTAIRRPLNVGEANLGTLVVPGSTVLISICLSEVRPPPVLIVAEPATM